MTWSTQQQSILSHSDLIEQSPRGSGNVPSNPKLSFILHSSQYHRDTWRIGRRSKNIACKMQRPKEGNSDPTTGISSALASLLTLSRTDRTARDFGFESCEKTYLGRDLLLPRHSCRGLSCRSASSAVPERSVRVATKVQQEEVCSKLQLDSGQETTTTKEEKQSGWFSVMNLWASVARNFGLRQTIIKDPKTTEKKPAGDAMVYQAVCAKRYH